MTVALEPGGFVNRMPRYEILSEEAMATIERGWRRLMREVGVRFDHPEAQRLFREAGQDVDDDGVVRLDPDFVLEQIALAPASFALRARNPARSVTIGGDHMVFANVAGPAVRARGRRRAATRSIADFERFIKLAHVYDEIDTQGGLPCEPDDLPLDSRHLDMQLAALTLSDKPHMGALFEGWKARDGLAMAAIVFGGATSSSAGPSSTASPTSTRRCATTSAMLDVLLAYAEAGQAVVVTPFLLMGAMSPVTIPAALVQQTAEALAGVALVQLVRPGAPVVLGSFLSHTDMQSGSPGFGGPESAHRAALLGPDRAPLRAAVALRRRLAHVQPAARRAGRLRGAQHDAAGVPGGRELRAARGRLARVRPRRELREVRHRHRAPARAARPSSRRSRSTRTSLAFDAHVEVGHGGHFLGAEHTLERFRDCFYRPLLSTTENFERWTRDGGARRDRARRRRLARGARALRAAADRRRHPRRAARVCRAQAARAGRLRER